VLLGSPEHRVRRAVASCRRAGAWEVAKVAFGAEGAAVLEREARALEELRPRACGVPQLLGLHRGAGITVLRLPYLTGSPAGRGDEGPALDLLERWIGAAAPRPAERFPEWPCIEAALAAAGRGGAALARLRACQLAPVVCHGDFARWNLLVAADGSVAVLDWEWGHDEGMPGIDLVHFFLQDARLVRRLAPREAVAAAVRALGRPRCAAYLRRTGWDAAPLAAVVACLAYKQGAGHQDNAAVLAAALDLWS
jgi:hypothetical protein